MRNLEIKAHCRDLARIRTRLRELGAERSEILRQTDTYYHVASGRLKLREMPDRCELIAYDRPDQTGPKPSDYEVVPVEEPVGLAGVLARALGVRIRVCKLRELWLRNGDRIHLDEVDGLGSFIELELPVGDGTSAARRRGEAEQLLSDLGIDRADLVRVSYADLLQEVTPSFPGKSSGENDGREGAVFPETSS